LLGNSGTVEGTNFLGTLDNTPVWIATNVSGPVTSGTRFRQNGQIEPTDIGQSVYVGKNTAQNVNLATSLNNVAVGYDSSQNMTDGSYNVSVGAFSLSAHTGATGCVAIGYEALKDNTQSQLTAVGAGALKNNTIGSQNTSTGFESLNLNTTGSNNTADGYKSLSANLVGSNNTSVGCNALAANLDSEMTAVGSGALQNYSFGNGGCVAVGFNALNANISCRGHVAIR